MKDINTAVAQLAAYAERTGLIEPCERTWAVNTLLEGLGLSSYAPPEGPVSGDADLNELLNALMDDAHARGVLPEDSIAYRDLFDTALMGRLTPRPAQVAERFRALYAQSPEAATDWYYKFSQDTNYIRRDRIARDMKWVTSTPYGDLDITINLSKPEKDPKAIAAARNLPASAYPRCQLCAENEGYAGRLDHPARGNHRIVPITINSSPWFLQYSPYVYYNEHCICLNAEHTPMKIDRACFAKLLDFTAQFPHYFVGSNADLPIVGGSILAHDHFQGGRFTFAMEKAPVERAVSFPGFEDVEAGIVKWPMSVIRIACADRARLVELADKILTSWRGYTDADAFVFAETVGEPHNTVTPIARKRRGRFELDLVLRNNITTAEHPMGLYHPHAELHHIKKENIGLIEVMGLAVLPARLKDELSAVADCLAAGVDLRADERTAKHADWAEGFRVKYPSITAENAMDIVKEETGLVFAQVLEHAGVYRRSEAGQAAFLKFIGQVN
ncbi:UDP-glucose--hexose-1-phosphate uridylyltransferase [Lawsonibacter faecis]|uniref:Galactose-1-phosphate uridylyltransferase n=1 Tax=Lawsonibacter faecis TaxID=2763052 RepID=A0A8J6MG09_9FIRM|nr:MULTISPECIES: UDP-glucose--hexose-1-phosphate uridylyltransferase [Oscillospiraceae]MTQ96368.1 UDP-glucose--hexose-1-phosphate uridylyltransferase [Pseudoflavonifractor sp. BIOML-A16]MTR05190.1 UDP-glucose--hexose-1-phosphate uridylyltransferase [Pseudoflavonifractor sp. BIOML-A15]MTR32474.1 UDP-glucose--hexose-1-phosphate uridylyltransferase [Pseudoflavonifractor sp. BIOML-A14]MTR73805.1 UDP-glucose--hexose-1-phosphate uridylyltransferase [Pseudoflavonifractor sp. BIOML-A18]MTS63117.1 UDP-